MCLSVSASPELLIRSSPKLLVAVYATYGCGTDHFLAGCNKLCTFSFMNDIIFAHHWPCGGMSILLQQVISLHRHVQTSNATAALYWLHHILDDGGRRNYTTSSCKGCGEQSVQCNTALFIFEIHRHSINS